MPGKPPLILAAPGQKSPGAKSGAPVEYVDIYATRAKELIGFAPSRTTSDVIEQLYGWPSVVHTPAVREVA